MYRRYLKELKYESYKFDNDKIPRPKGKQSSRGLLKSANAYYEAIRPMLIIMQVFGRFPYKIEPNGIQLFHFMSRPMLYCLLFFLVQSSYSIWCAKKIYFEIYLKSQTLEESTTAIIFTVLLLSNFLVPFMYWWGAKNMVKLIQEWQHFQKRFLSEKYELRTRTFLKRCSLIAVPYTAGMNYLMLSYLAKVGYDITSAFVPIAFCLHYDLILWLVSLYEIRRLAERLSEKMLSDGLFHKLERRRQMWVTLNGLTAQTGLAFSHQLIPYFFSHFCIVFSSTFLFFRHLMLAPQLSLHNLLSKVSFASLSLGFTALMSFSAQYTLDSLGEFFLHKILSVKLLKPDRTHIPLLLRFVDTIQKNPPELNLSGFLEVNRNLVAKFYVGTLAYLIVLLQIYVPMQQE